MLALHTMLRNVENGKEGMANQQIIDACTDEESVSAADHALLLQFRGRHADTLSRSSALRPPNAVVLGEQLSELGELQRSHLIRAAN
jgi:hypothetical protein